MGNTNGRLDGDFTLMGPVKYRHKVDESIHAMIKDHIAEFYDVNVEEIDPVIPQRMEQWTKTKIRNRGDTIRGSKRRYNKTDRDTSFIRVSYLQIVHSSYL